MQNSWLNDVLTSQMDMKKLEQTLIDERSQRQRMASALQAATAKVNELEDRLRATEIHARENKAALATLVGHTRNVERAVTAGQQDLVQRKEQQAAK